MVLMVSFQVIYLWFRYNYNVVHITYLFIVRNINIFAYLVYITQMFHVIIICSLQAQKHSRACGILFYKNPQIRKTTLGRKWQAREHTKVMSH